MTTRDILKRFQQISDADLSLADIQWLTRTINEAIEEAQGETKWKLLQKQK